MFNGISDCDLMPFKGYVEVDRSFLEEVRSYGLVFVYDAPAYLPFWTLALRSVGYKFRYHVVLFFSDGVEGPLVRSHVGLGVYYLNEKSYSRLRKYRIPHAYCKACGQALKDWGGKKRLMHPEGVLLSDVWKHLDLKREEVFSKSVPQKVLAQIEKMVDFLDVKEGARKVFRSQEDFHGKEAPASFENVLLCGSAVDILKGMPENSVDVIFVDPPYNLNKPYEGYKDLRKDYIEWCVGWIRECLRVLKPKGSFFILNTPENIHRIYPLISEEVYLQDWIAWDSPGEPKGKLIPAHYSILWLSKTREVKFRPLGLEQDSMDYCLRIACRKCRAFLSINDKEVVKNVRWDIHRVKHSSKRLNHPTQLPPKLLDFLIRLTTDENDLVLDPMMGTGTTPYVAKSLGRKYVGIEISRAYVEEARKRLWKVC